MVGRALRICVVGDELVAGAGDSKGLGWVGRVVARTQSEIPPIVMTLAVPGETTTALGLRWDQETTRRFSPEADNRLVVALGRADQRAGISPARSRLNLANILDVAEARHLPARGTPRRSPSSRVRTATSRSVAASRTSTPSHRSNSTISGSPISRRAAPGCRARPATD